MRRVTVRQQVAVVVLQQGVEADGVLAGEMAVDRRIAEGIGQLRTAS